MRQLFFLFLVFGLNAGQVMSQENDLTPIVTAEITEDSVLVGQPVVLRITVLVPTWMPSPPQFPSLEAPNLILRLPERASGPVSQTINGETWSGVSRAYRLYPMVPGPFYLPSQPLTLTYADPEDTSPVTLEIPVPSMSFTATVPDAAKTLDPLIIAEGLTLEQEFDGPDDVLAEGEAVKRSMVARIEGSSALFLPDLLEPVAYETVQVYKDEPTMSETEERGILSGSRNETITYVARYGGTLTLPDISLEWFNIGSGQVETATLEGRSFVVDAPEKPRVPILNPRQIFMLVVFMLLAIFAVWAFRRWVWPKIENQISRRKLRHLASEKYAADQLETAIQSRDLARVATAQQQWDQRLPACAAKEEDGFRSAILAIGEALFGEGSSADWPAVAVAFKKLRIARLDANKRSATTSALPPLNPFLSS